jgi:SAM-dependent methyltransferase
MEADQVRSVQEHFRRVGAVWTRGYGGRRYLSHLDLQERRGNIHRLLEPLLAGQETRLRALDLGCGTGDVLRGLARERLLVVGVDLVPEMLIVAMQNNPEDRFAASDAAHLPFRPGSFDVVISAGVFEYLPDPPAALRGVRELLRPGGHLILSLPNRASLFRKLSRIEEACERPLSRALARLRGLSPTDAPPRHYRHTQWSPWAGRRLLRDCGFDVSQTLFNTYGMRGWLGSFAASWRLSSWLTRRFAENEPVSAFLAHTIVLAARRN